MSEESDLFKRLGGRKTVEAVTKHMAKKVAADPLLAPVFSDIGGKSSIYVHVAYLAMAFDATIKYSDEDLSRLHAKAVKEKGVSNEHFDALAGHLKSSMEEEGISAELIAEVLSRVECRRKDILSIQG